MNKLLSQSVLILAGLFVLGGCGSSPSSAGSSFETDRDAILKMVGTYAVSFEFEETLSLREGYELHEPYRRSAEELVVLIEDRGDLISLQHLLVVRYEGQTHVINHWRQDWVYEGETGHRFVGDNTWEPIAYDRAARRGAWVQSVFNVADSPRYSSIGRWSHRNGTSSWTGSPILRPLPLRENALSDLYTFLDSVNTVVVTDQGWLHIQQNQKLEPGHATQPVLAMERGLNRYERTPDTGFDEAKDYWANTAPYWAQVRGVWSQVFAQGQPITLRRQWQGESLFMHLNALADDYWGDEDASDAQPAIQEIIAGFLSPDTNTAE